MGAKKRKRLNTNTVPEYTEVREPLREKPEPEFPEFLDSLSDSDNFKAKLWEHLVKLGMEDPKLAVIRKKASLAPVLRGIYLNLGADAEGDDGKGDGYELVEAYLGEYSARLENGEKAKY